MAKVDVLGTERVFSAEPGRQGKMDRLVTYKTEDGTVRYVTVPDETYTLAAAENAIRAAETERTRAKPHTLPL